MRKQLSFVYGMQNVLTFQFYRNSLIHNNVCAEAAI